MSDTELETVPTKKSKLGNGLFTKAVSELKTNDNGAKETTFEAQEDYISFDFKDDDDIENETPNSRYRSGKKNNRSNKRQRDGEDESTARLIKREKTRSAPWCQDLDFSDCSSPIDMLNLEVGAFIRYISPTGSEHQLRLWTIELIRRVIQKRWADADVQCFGSVGTGLYLPGGDIDLVVLSPSLPSPPLKPSGTLLHHLASLLLNSSIAEPSSIAVISKAKVPIVKFVTRYGGFAVDLSVNQKNGLEASVKVRDMLERYSFKDESVEEASVNEESDSDVEKVEKPKDKKLEQDLGAARCLTLLLKTFLNQRGMNEVFTGGLSGYSIVCLVISFLQLHPKIQTGEILPSRNMGLLFVELLEYYGKHFNFDDAGITIRGKGGYFNKRQKNWFNPKQPYLLSIEDPNDTSNDISGGSHNIMRVRQTIAGAYDCLTATLYQRASEFAALKNLNNVPLSSSLLPNSDDPTKTPFQKSILGSIVGMSTSALMAREENINLFEQGILQDLMEKSDPYSGMSKKAMKKKIKALRKAASMERTANRLETKRDRAETKEKRRESRRSKSLDIEPSESGVLGLTAAVTGYSDEEYDQIRPPVFTPTGGRSTHESSEEDSRYTIGVNRKGKKQPPVLNAVFIQESESDNDASEGDDIIIGGSKGGDMLQLNDSDGQFKVKSTDSRSNSRSRSQSRSNSVDGGLKESVNELRNRIRAKERAKKSKKEQKKKTKEVQNKFWAAKGRKEIGVDGLEEYTSD